MFCLLSASGLLGNGEARYRSIGDTVGKRHPYGFKQRIPGSSGLILKRRTLARASRKPGHPNRTFSRNQTWAHIRMVVQLDGKIHFLLESIHHRAVNGGPCSRAEHQPHSHEGLRFPLAIVSFSLTRCCHQRLWHSILSLSNCRLAGIAFIPSYLGEIYKPLRDGTIPAEQHTIFMSFAQLATNILAG